MAWWTHDVGEEADDPYEVHAAVLGAGRTRFAEAQLLDRGARVRPRGELHVAAEQRGRATVAWSTPLAEGLHPVRTARQRDGLRFGTPQTLAPNGAVEGLATGLRDRALLVWAPFSGGVPLAEGLVAAERPADGAWQAPTPVTDDRVTGADAGFARGAAVPVVAWSTGTRLRLTSHPPA